MVRHGTVYAPNVVSFRNSHFIMYLSFARAVTSMLERAKRGEREGRKMAPKVAFLTFLCLLSLFMLTYCSEEPDDEKDFNYSVNDHKGPKNWGHIHPEWRSCNIGKLQSPIDLLHERVQVMPKLGRLKKSYKPAPAVLVNRGHDIMLKWKNESGGILIDGIEFLLKQIHWHSPSEHTFNGTRYKLELHMVHESRNGELAVIGITYKYGRPDTFLQKVLAPIKLEGFTERDVGIVDPKDIKFGSRKYFRYLGSLTVPPCTEGVIWTILSKVRTVSREQVRALREAVHDGFEQNSRPTQDEDNRTVAFYRPKTV